jgi:hypothetical protein
MSILLAKIVGDVHDGRKTGVLTVFVKGGNHLLKLFFREGECYHLTCGNLKNTECIDSLKTIELGDCLFVPDVKLDASGSSITSMDDLISRLTDLGVMVEAKLANGGAKAAGKDDSADGKKLEMIKLALIRQIGPAGGKVMTRIVESKWHASVPYAREDIDALINLLKNEIDDQDAKNAFMTEAGKAR